MGVMEEESGLSECQAGTAVMIICVRLLWD